MNNGNTIVEQKKKRKHFMKENIWTEHGMRSEKRLRTTLRWRFLTNLDNDFLKFFLFIHFLLRFHAHADYTLETCQKR